MAGPDTKNLFRGVNSILPPAVLAGLAFAVWLAAKDYGSTARQLPMLVAAILFLLTILDLASRLPGRFGRLLHFLLGAGFEDPEMKHTPRWTAEVLHVAWVVTAVASIVVFGFLVTIPALVFAYSKFHGRWPMWLSAATAGITTAIVALVFEVLLDYGLYRGIFFGADFHV